MFFIQTVSQEMFKLLMSPGMGSWQLEFKSLIIVIVVLQNSLKILFFFLGLVCWSWSSNLWCGEKIIYWVNLYCDDIIEYVFGGVTRTGDNVVITTKGLQDRNIHILDGTTVENKGKLIITEIFPSVQKHDI